MRVDLLTTTLLAEQRHVVCLGQNGILLIFLFDLCDPWKASLENDPLASNVLTPLFTKERSWTKSITPWMQAI